MGQTVKEPSDLEIRQAIAEVIRKALTDLYGATLGNEIIIHDHWLWGFNLKENAALLKIRTGEQAGVIHGWLIGLVGVTRERPEPKSTREGTYRLRNMNPNLRNLVRTYRLWNFHQMDAGDSENNSENRLAIEVEAVADELSRTPLLGIKNPHLMGHEELQLTPVDIFMVGNAQANVAQGSLNVVLKKPLDLNQY